MPPVGAVATAMADPRLAMREHLAALLETKKSGGGSQDELRRATSEGTVALLRLKAAHRTLAEAAEGHREAAAEAKGTFEQGSLQLHNIQYEASHYGKQIRSCRNFKVCGRPYAAHARARQPWGKLPAKRAGRSPKQAPRDDGLARPRHSD